MRKAHYLKVNHKTELPTQFIFVDTESNIEQVDSVHQKHTLKFGWACYVRLGDDRQDICEWFRFEDAESFWLWCEGKIRARSKCWLFAHNWNFDAAMISTHTYILRRGWRVLQYINDSNLFLLKARKDTKTIVLCDTANFFRCSLATLAKSVGLEKFELPPQNASREIWDRYTRNDVQILVDIILSLRKFIRQHKLGTFQVSAASQAMNSFRHRFMHHPILVHDNEDVLRLERNAYFGGRTEAYYIGEQVGNFYLLDVNSMYPSVMRYRYYPIRLVSYVRDTSVSLLQLTLKHHVCIAHVVLRTNSPYYPKRINDHLVFPVGEFETYLADAELRVAIDNHHVREVLELATYESAHIFDDYVNFFYDLKRKYSSENNLAYTYLCKLMLNSLYGKFGQKHHVWETVDISEPPLADEWLEQDGDDAPVVHYRMRFGLVQRQAKDDETENSIPAISACVTSAARVRLLHFIQLAGWEHVYYVDTDSLLVDDAGYERLKMYINSSKLGWLKLEKYFNHIKIYSPKDYVFDNVVKRKGIRHDAEQLASDTYTQYHFRSYEHTLAQNDDGYIIVEKVVKKLKRDYNKGVVLANGRVIPYVLPQ
ncbi:MAG: DNA polymerase [Halobacteria archaeon]